MYISVYRSLTLSLSTYIYNYIAVVDVSFSID